MPTVFRYEGYRFFFFSDDHLPRHVHIEKGDSYVRIELSNLKVTDSYHISQKEIRKLQKLVESKRDILKGAWDEYFS